MRALVLAGLLLCSLTSHAQGDQDPFNNSIYKWLAEARDPSIKTSFGLAAVSVAGTAIFGSPDSEGPFGYQADSDGLIGLGTIDVAIDAPFDARGSVTAGLGFLRGDGFAFARGSLLEGSIGVVMAGGFRDMLTVSGPAATTGTVSVFGRVGETSRDVASLHTFTSSGALLDSDFFVSSGSASSFQLAVDVPHGAEVLLVLENLSDSGRIEAVQGGPPVSTRFDLAVDRIEASQGLNITASSGGLRTVDGSYVYAPIPEPSTIALMLAGLLVIFGTCSARTRNPLIVEDVGLVASAASKLAVRAITVAVLKAPGA